MFKIYNEYHNEKENTTHLIDNRGLQATIAGHMCKFHKRKEKIKNGATYIKVEVVYLVISALRITNPLCTVRFMSSP